MAREPGVPAEVAGSTLTELARSTEGRIDLTGEEGLTFHTRSGNVRVAYGSVHTLEYGQRVGRRYAEAILISPVLVLSKSRKHYVTVGFTDVRGSRQALVLRIGKNDIRAVLAGLEAKTGRKVEFQDEEARHRGRD